jgi:hypothetical protein
MVRGAAALSALVVIAWIAGLTLTLGTSTGDGSLTVFFLTLYALGGLGLIWLTVALSRFLSYSGRAGKALLADPDEADRFANRNANPS